MGLSPVAFRFRVGLDWYPCMWPDLLIQVAEPDSVLTLGSGGWGEMKLEKGISERKDANSALKDITTG